MTIKADRGSPALGRGLASLIPQRTAAITAVVDVPVARIAPNPYQPRHRIDDAGLEELARASASTASSSPSL